MLMELIQLDIAKLIMTFKTFHLLLVEIIVWFRIMENQIFTILDQVWFVILCEIICQMMCWKYSNLLPVAGLYAETHSIYINEAEIKNLLS